MLDGPLLILTHRMLHGSFGERPAGPAPHLLHHEVVEQRHHPHVQRLHPLLSEEAPEDLEAAQLEELLLGVREVSQHGGQCEQGLGGQSSVSTGVWPPLRHSLFPASRGTGETRHPVYSEPLAEGCPHESPCLPIPALPTAARLPEPA